MASVNSYSDIPGSSNFIAPDFQTFNRYSAACGRAANDLAQLETSFSPIQQVISDTIESLNSAITTTDSIKNHFSNGAYNDGQCTYVDDLEKCSTDLNSLLTDLSSILGEVDAYLSDVTSLGSFAVNQANTWANAAQYALNNNDKIWDEYTNY